MSNRLLVTNPIKNCGLAALVVAAFTGCAATDAPRINRIDRPPAPDASLTEKAPASSPDQAGKVRPGLNLRIMVLVSGVKEFDETSRQVSARGTLEVPLVGKVEVAGLTLQEVEVLLTERFKEFLVQPQVVVEYVHGEGSSISPWGYVTVLGRVRNPGKLPVPATRDLTVSAAIQQAGGFDTSARTSKIRVTRQMPTGETRRMTVDLRAYAKGDLDEDLLLHAGDVVFVPESAW
jgi:polysaccharide export outer membrane protein